MIRHACLAILASSLIGCGTQSTESSTSAATSTSAASSTSTQAIASLNGMRLQAMTIPTDNLDAASAKRYGIRQQADTVLLLITVRDAAGNAVATDGLQLQAEAGPLQQPAQPLQLREITTDGMHDWIAEYHAKPPASVRFRIQATQGRAQAQMDMTRDFLPQ